MSRITSIILITGLIDERHVATLNAMLEKHPDNVAESIFTPLEHRKEHGRNMQNSTYHAVALNYPMDAKTALIDLFCSLDWDIPETAILIMEPEEGRTEIYRPDDEKAKVGDQMTPTEMVSE